MSGTNLVRRDIPLAIIFICGVIVLLDPFLSIPSYNAVAGSLQIWGTVLVAFTMIMAVFKLVRTTLITLQKRTTKYWWLTGYGLCLTFITLYLGLTSNPSYSTWYSTMAKIVKSAIYGCTGLYTVSSFYRAFRVRNIGAGLLTITAVFTLIGNASFGSTLWAGFPIIKDWLQFTTNASYIRGAAITLGIGAIAFGIRTLIGREKGQIGAIEG